MFWPISTIFYLFFRYFYYLHALTDKGTIPKSAFHIVSTICNHLQLEVFLLSNKQPKMTIIEF